ncbi:hypothetical protein [Klebsiella pneumoniae]|uniref:phosphoribosylanthranilate isomerase n=1 Tax=Klebsiella pneumoniae TaxID=573 RepID=UPI002949F7E3|nr:hypothetical protein [Klebsiella pneumoniae]MDV5727786.1 hypothetical protein [Klebsiella pneumoniae]
MGLAFDWSLLAGYRGALPWGLAGGLNPTNVAEAIARTGAPLVDTQRRRCALGVMIPTRLPISPLCAWPKSRRSIGVVQRKDRLAGAPLPSGEVGKI